MKRLFLPLLGFLSLVLMCCNDNKESGTDSYDPNKPVTIDYFTSISVSNCPFFSFRARLTL